MQISSSRLIRFVAGLMAVLACCGLAHADDLDGTWWKLTMRKLPDGTSLTPPAVYGASTFKDGVNQLLVHWHTPEGKPASISQISKWEWSDTEVAVTAVLMIIDDGSGKPPTYISGGDRKTATITRRAGQISYQHPINAPFIVRDGDKFTATLEGAFTDYWERIR
jgi:hypothetical protein